MSAATFRPGDRVVSTSTYSPGVTGTVRGVVVHPARLDDDGTVLVPERTVVSVDVDGQAAGTAFVADAGQPLDLARLDDVPTSTVYPVAAASTASITFTLVSPGVVDVRNEYGDAVAYPLRGLTTALLGLWVRGGDDDTVVAS